MYQLTGPKYFIKLFQSKVTIYLIKVISVYRDCEIKQYFEDFWTQIHFLVR